MRIKIQKALLKELYLKKKLTTREVAKFLDCSQKKVLYWLKKYKISTRKGIRKSKFNITKELLTDFYINKKFSINKTASELKCSYGNVHYFLRKYNLKLRSIGRIPIYTKNNFSGNLIEKSYLIGLRLGDISTKRTSNKTIRVQTSTTHLSQVEMFRETFEKYGPIGFYQSQGIFGNEIRVWCDLNNSFSFILKKPRRIPIWIFNDENIFFSFLAGFMDCEGTWVINKSHENSKSFEFQIGNTDKMILQGIKNKLENLEFNPKFYLKKSRHSTFKNNKDLFVLRIFQLEKVLKLARIMLHYSHHIEKINKMKIVLSAQNLRWSEIKPLMNKFHEWQGSLLVNNKINEVR